MTMTKRSGFCDEFIMMTLDQIVPENHLVRKLDHALDWSFIYDLVQDHYSPVGRKSIDPVVLFKIYFLNIILGNNSLRKTCRDIETDAALRWFLGIPFTMSVPNYSDWSQNYIRRFKDTDVCDRIFLHIISELDKNGYLNLDSVFVDSTHQKASANKQKHQSALIEQVKKYSDDELLETINQKRAEDGKKPFNSLKKNELTFDEKTGEEIEVPVPLMKEVKQSTTDPESGLFHKGEKEKCFAYSQHVICDGNGFVVAVRTFPGNIHDSVSFFETFESIPEEISERIRAAALDAGYKTPAVARYLELKNVTAFMPYKRPMTKKGFFYKSRYSYDAQRDEHVCPNGEILRYTTTNRSGYREYKSDPKKCELCPLRQQCTNSKNMIKVITRHVWQEYSDKVEGRRNSAEWKEVYPKRKETIERVFAENKERHNLRYTRVRGLAKNQFQATMLFACHNLLKMARWKWNSEKRSVQYAI